MTPANKAKGDKAEREAAELLTALTGRPVRRMLGAGRQDDRGDLEGLPGVAVQVAYWPSRTLAAYVSKPDDAAEQAINSGLDLGVAMIRHKGLGNRPGIWRVAMLPEQFSVLLGYAERGGLGK